MLKATAQGVLRDAVSDDWKFIANKREVTLSSRTTADTSVQQVRAIAIVNGSLENVLKHLTDPFCRRGKKDAVIECREIVVDEKTGEKKLYRAQKMPWPLLARDFVLESNVMKMQDGSAIWAVRSTADPSFPAVENRVRADCKNSSWVIRPLHKFKCHVTYIAQIDLKGNIPLKIKNKFMTQEAMWVADICRFFQRQMNNSINRSAAPPIGGSLKQTFLTNRRVFLKASTSNPDPRVCGGGGGECKEESKEESKEDCKESESLCSSYGSYRGGGIRAKSLKKASGFEIKPLSKNSREYLKEIVTGRDGGGGSRGGSFSSWGSFSGKGMRTPTKKQGSCEYQWKKLRDNSREYFRDVFIAQQQQEPLKGYSDDCTPPSSPPGSPKGFLPEIETDLNSSMREGRSDEDSGWTGRLRRLDPLTPAGT